MNLFEYTKRISEKIRFYDSLLKESSLNGYNPFVKPITLTIIWVENEKE